MKLVLDEKVKHRLIGIAVIISIGAIFAPAIMKKSNQRLESNFSVNVQLPPKPVAPDVVMTDEKDMFKTIKIAKVTVTDVSDQKQLPQSVQAETIKSDSNSKVADSDLIPENKIEPIKIAADQAAKKTARDTIKVAVVSRPVVKAKPVTIAQRPKKAPKVNKPVKVAKITKPALKHDIYAVQLASFSQLSNAQSLVNRLHGKGYKASFAKVPGRQGATYKVYVGHSSRKVDVMRLKVQLASAMQLNGFVVNTGVS